jgi:glycosyltransferase involved in cell wall biosynthesis
MLRRAIESLLTQSLSSTDYEIVVVDNASTDGTPAVVDQIRSQHQIPTIVLLTESQQGLGYARNTGCERARGSFIAFMDDDCVAARDWLESLLHCFDHVQPIPWSVGGIIVPVYEATKPVWFKDRYETDTWGDQPRFLKRGESFTGCNMSFRKDVIERFGGFDVELGMKGETLAVAEETKLYLRIWSTEGHIPTFYYTPRAVMYHTIDPYKMTVSYQLKRAFSAGQASWALAQMEPMSRRCVLCVGSIGLILWYSARALLHIRPGHWQSWAVEELYPVAFNMGRLSGYLGVRMAFRQRNATTLCSS